MKSDGPGSGPEPGHDYRLIVFDFDGTLVDSQYVIAKAMAEAFASDGLAAPSRAVIRRCVGLRLEVVVARLLGQEEVLPQAERLADQYRAAFVRMRAAGDLYEPLFPWVAETLAGLDHPRVLLAIATGKNRRGLAYSLDHHGLSRHFPILKTADDGPGKPHPAILEAALAEAGVEPDEAILIGDTSFDMEMAHNAGVAAIGAGWGYHDSAELMDAGAQCVLDGIDQLPGCLSEMGRG